MPYFKRDISEVIEEQIKEVCDRKDLEFSIEEILVKKCSKSNSTEFVVNLSWIFSDELDWDDEKELCERINAEIKENLYHDLPYAILTTYGSDVDLSSEIVSLSDFLMESEIEFLKSEKERLKNSESPNLFNSPEAIDKFSELADNQRGAPELQMLVCQKLLGTGVLPHQLEHIGDLTHRVAQRIYSDILQPERALTDILPKINRGISSLRHGYGFEKEYRENLASNYKYGVESNSFPTFEEFQSKVNEELEKYALEHEKLEVFNEFQYHCREAAICLGRQEFNSAAEHLEILKEWIENDLFLEKASGFTPGYKPEIKSSPRRRNSLS